MFSSTNFGSKADAILEVTCEFYDVGDTVEWEGFDENNDFFSVDDIDSCLKDWEHPDAEEIESTIADEKDAAFERGDSFVRGHIYSLDENAHHTAEVTKPFIVFNVCHFTSGFPDCGLKYDIEAVGIRDALGTEQGGADFMVNDAHDTRKEMLKFWSKGIGRDTGEKDPVRELKLLYLTSYWSSRDYWGEWDAGLDVEGLIDIHDIYTWIHRHQANEEVAWVRMRVLGFFMRIKNRWDYHFKWRIKRKLKEWKTRVGSKRKSKNT